MSRIVFIVSGLCKSDGNTPICDWRLLSAKQFKEYLKLVEWDEEVVYKVDLAGTGISLYMVDGDNYHCTDAKHKLRDLNITAYQIGSDHKRLDTELPCPWNSNMKRC